MLAVEVGSPRQVLPGVWLTDAAKAAMGEGGGLASTFARAGLFLKDGDAEATNAEGS